MKTKTLMSETNKGVIWSAGFHLKGSPKVIPPSAQLGIFVFMWPNQACLGEEV
jgi:hypothetical protein